MKPFFGKASGFGLAPSKLWTLVLVVASCSPPFTSNNEPVFYADSNPGLLSDWNLFSGANHSLKPLSDNTLVYSLNSSLFSDYADKFRTISLPANTRARLDSDGSINFPNGTIISKTFSYPEQLLETRLLVKRETGWEALPYVWNNQKHQATLKRTGAIIKLKNSGGNIPANYIVPNTNQCAGCHQLNQSIKQIEPIGPNIKNIPVEQLQEWIDTGYLTISNGLSLVQVANNNAINVNWQDVSLPIDVRARAYLDINCGHCHSPTGPGDTSGLYLNNSDVKKVRLGVCKAPIAAGQGTGGNLFSIVPGQPENSIMIYRMNSTDPGAMMPELGRTLAHLEAVELLSNWIKAMEGDCVAL